MTSNGTAFIADGIRIQAMRGSLVIEISDLVPMDQALTIPHAYGAYTLYCGRLAHTNLMASIALAHVRAAIRKDVDRRLKQFQDTSGLKP